MMVVDVDPAMFPGLIIQLPAGSPSRTTLPVPTAQVGCVIVPTPGADGVDGWAFMVAEAGEEMHVLSIVLLTRIVCGPGATPENTTAD